MKKKRWMPKYGKYFWYIRIDYESTVSLDVWSENEYDERFYNNHNCFRTKKEAQAALKRVRKALRG